MKELDDLMKKMTAIVFALLMVFLFAACGGAAEGTFESGGRQYITADQLKADMDAGKDLFLLDIQPEENFNKNHLRSAVATFAFPVKTDEEKAKVDDVLDEAAGKALIIVCPGGKSGANNTWDHLVSSGYDMSTVYILENGQNGWPYPELLATDAGGK